MGVIRRYKKQYGIFFGLFLILNTLFIGIVQQEQYQALTDAFSEVGPEIVGGEFDNTTKALALFGAAVTGSLGEPLSELQQFYIVLLGLFTWLVMVWFLRHQLSGTNVRVRDALYNSGAPFISTVLVGLLATIQLLPAAIGILAYTAARAAGILTGGVESMMFAVGAGLLVVLSLYWVTSSFFAALIVTIPGTYPMAAIKMGSDIVIGRRLSVMLRLLWLLFVLAILWFVILIPMIFLSGAIDIAWLPLVPVTIQILGAISILFATTYIYVLYRRMIDEPSK